MSLVRIIAGPILYAVFHILWIYQWILIISIILSWVRPDPYNPIVRFLNSITYPVLNKVREWLPFLKAGMIDFSPIIVFVAIRILMNFIRYMMDSLMGIAVR